MSYFDVRFTPDPRRAVVWREIVSYLRPWLGGRKRVLEIGAGYCAFINAVDASERVALDVDKIVVSYVVQGVKPVIADLRTNQPFSTKFDAVLASNIFEHFDDAEFDIVLSRVMDVLASRGILVVIQPNFRTAFRNYFDDYTHKKIFTDEGLCEVLEAHGFHIMRREACFLPYSLRTVPSRMPLWLIRFAVRCYLRMPWRPYAGQMLVIAEKKGSLSSHEDMK